MSGIDWSWQDVQARKDAEREADEANRRSSRLAKDLDAADGNAQADIFTITALQRKVTLLEERLAEAEGKLRHLTSREAGFLAEVRALIRENEACPHPEHHRLHVEDENKRAMLDDIFVAAYDAKWEELGKA